MNDINITDIVADGAFRSVRSGRIGSGDGRVQLCAAVDARKLSVTVAAGACVRLVVVHSRPQESSVEIELEENASLEVVQVFLCNVLSGVRVRQHRDSRCRFIVAELGSANASYVAELDGKGAEWSFDGAFVGTDNDRCAIALDTRHNVAECRSASMVRGVVSGRASGDFRGLVYVACDAQHTDARQQSRNIELGEDARISVSPQLEIYADDVKCTHGATVGGGDDEALLYMRQRGIDEKAARRLQIEGFVKAVVAGCSMDTISEALEAEIDKKLMKL